MNGIEYVVDGRVATLTLNRGEVNAFTVDMAETFHKYFVDADENPEVGVVCITGKGERFSGGLDLREIDPSDTRRILYIQDQVMNPIVKGIYGSNKPVVCAMNGPAAGAGMMFGLAADLTYMKRGSRLAFTFLDRHLSPACGATYILPALVGERKARELILLREKVDAEEAVRLGLITGVYDEFSEVEARVAQIAEIDPALLAAEKKAARGDTPYDLGHCLRHEVTAQEETIDGFQAAVEKFLGKK